MEIGNADTKANSDLLATIGTRDSGPSWMLVRSAITCKPSLQGPVTGYCTVMWQRCTSVCDTGSRSTSTLSIETTVIAPNAHLHCCAVDVVQWETCGSVCCLNSYYSEYDTNSHVRLKTPLPYRIHVTPRTVIAPLDTVK